MHSCLGLAEKYLPKCLQVLIVFSENFQFFTEELDWSVILLSGRSYNSSWFFLFPNFYFCSEMNFLVRFSLLWWASAIEVLYYTVSFNLKTGVCASWKRLSEGQKCLKCYNAFLRSLKYFDSEIEMTIWIKTFLAHLYLTVHTNPSASSHFPEQLY